MINKHRRYSIIPPRVDFGTPGGGWRKIVLRGVLRGGQVEQALRGGGWFVLVSQGVSRTNICGNWSMNVIKRFVSSSSSPPPPPCPSHPTDICFRINPHETKENISRTLFRFFSFSGTSVNLSKSHDTGAVQKKELDSPIHRATILARSIEAAAPIDVVQYHHTLVHWSSPGDSATFISRSWPPIHHFTTACEPFIHHFTTECPQSHAPSGTMSITETVHFSFLSNWSCLHLHNYFKPFVGFFLPTFAGENKFEAFRDVSRFNINFYTFQH
jgi:hypothetical protein